MLAQNNEYLEEAANSIYQANAEEIVRQQCRAREDAERRERTLIRNYNLMKDELSSTKEDLVATKEDLAAANEDLAAANEDLAAANARIQELEKALAASQK